MAFQDNTQKNRFELDVDGSVAFANYEVKGDTLYIQYVEAPTELRGTGAASQLMRHVMEKAREDQHKVIPICGYAATWITRHPEYDDIKG